MSPVAYRRPAIFVVRPGAAVGARPKTPCNADGRGSCDLSEALKYRTAAHTSQSGFDGNAPGATALRACSLGENGVTLGRGLTKANDK